MEVGYLFIISALCVLAGLLFFWTNSLEEEKQAEFKQLHNEINSFLREERRKNNAK